MHKVKTGLFYIVNLKTLDKKVRLQKTSKYLPLRHWDFITDLSYRFVTTTMCGVLLLLSTQRLVDAARVEQTLASVYCVLGGYETQGLHSCESSLYSAVLLVHRSTAAEMEEGQRTAQSDHAIKSASLINYNNPPTLLFFTLCGHIETKKSRPIGGRNQFKVERNT